ncbi:MFS transporter [Siculibacillus lacustris]|uniref:MFS transporter n=1 Tax=Siculibacillus lacustris TaxID=1549641 RepID=A0A4Q9VN08_9HYPH|nr:MFS transporter [Siculibacillus lacustris]TBW36076.1 MFS transporter [Siculibacillus lacustris]
MKFIPKLRWKMLALMLLGTIVIYVDRNVLGVLAPVLKKELDFTTEQYSYVVSAFQIVYSFSQPVAGYLTDLIGPRIGYAVAAFVWGAAAALHAASSGWVSMAGFRALLGLSEAVAMPTGTKTSTLWFPPQERSIATGWFNSGSSIGAMITPPLVIWLSTAYGWKPAFVITGLLGCLLSVVWYWLYRDPESHPRLSPEERLYINSGKVDGTVAKPSLKAVFAQKKFIGVVIARFLTEPAWQTFAFWIPLYMVTVRGMDIKQFALFAWLPFLFSDLGCIGGGYLAPFFHKRLNIGIVNCRLLVITIGALCMVGPALISFVVSPVAAILCFSLGGFAHQMLSSMMYAVVGDVFEKSEVATATGIAGMFGYLGGAIFTLVVGALATTLGYEPLFALLFLFDVVAAVVLWIFIGQRGGRPVVAQPAE